MTDALRIKFDPKYLQQIVPFMAQTDIRYYLCGINVERAERGGVYVMACDGHTLAVVYDKDGSIEGQDSAIFRVTPATIAAAKAASKKPSLGHQVIVMGQRVFIGPDFDAFGDAREYFVQPGRSLIEGKYPEWRKVVPDFSKLKRGCAFGSDAINATYLARLDRVCSQDNRGAKGVTLWQKEGGSTSVIAQIAGAPELLVVIMPMRGSDDSIQRSLFKPFAIANPAPATAPANQPSDAEPVPA